MAPASEETAAKLIKDNDTGGQLVGVAKGAGAGCIPRGEGVGGRPVDLDTNGPP